ncbi:MAG: hypothetical protein HZY73_11415 [Micropruina sp.]|nr:MAG: hypothetical protein HZY73_11415 [Micropruina sp.]
MNRTDLETWLGPALEQMSVREVDAFAAMVERIDRLHPEAADDRPMGTWAMNGALQVQLGDDTLAGLAAAYLRALESEREAWAMLQGAMIASDAAGLSQSEIARQASVTRVTVARTLGR